MKIQRFDKVEWAKEKQDGEKGLVSPRKIVERVKRLSERAIGPKGAGGGGIEKKEKIELGQGKKGIEIR